MVSVTLQGWGPCSLWKVQAWMVLPGAGLVFGVSFIWISVLPLVAWVPAILEPAWAFWEVPEPSLGQ